MAYKTSWIIIAKFVSHWSSAATNLSRMTFHPISNDSSRYFLGSLGTLEKNELFQTFEKITTKIVKIITFYVIRTLVVAFTNLQFSN